MKNLFICDYIFVSCSTLNTYMFIPCRVHWKHPSWWRSGSSRSRDRTHPGALWIQTWVMIQDKLYFSPWWPLLWLLTWYPIFKSSHCNSFEERAPVSRTHFQMNYVTWLHAGHQGHVSVSDKTSYCKISWSLETARFVFKIVQSLWNSTGGSAALLPTCLSNVKAMR